jgi:hypothetical protein
VQIGYLNPLSLGERGSNNRRELRPLLETVLLLKGEGRVRSLITIPTMIDQNLFEYSYNYERGE